MYPEFWLKNWSIPSTESAVKLQELVRLGYEHAVARAEASARMARSLSACRTPFDAIAVYQDWIVAESQRIVGDMRRMAELSKALLESTGQALNNPSTPPMIAVADAMIRSDEKAPAETPAAVPPKEAAKADPPKPDVAPEPKVEPEGQAAAEVAKTPEVEAPVAAEPAVEQPTPVAKESEEPAPLAGVAVAGTTPAETAADTEETKPRRKRKSAAAE